MKDNFNLKIKKMAQKEKLELPDGYDERIEQILNNLPRKKKHISFKMVPVLVAALVLLLSISVTAAVNYVMQRMAEMEEEKVQQYYEDLQNSQAGADSYSRKMTEKEQERYEELKNAYQSEGLFPDGEIKKINKGSEYDGAGVAFLGTHSMFFLPENEMTDEELLQIIDFIIKRDYSLQEIQDKIKAGEITAVEPKLDISKDSIELSQDDRIIEYSGDMKAQFIAASEDAIYFSEIRQTWNDEKTYLYSMMIGTDTPVRMNVEAPEDMQFTSMTTDAENNLIVCLISYGEIKDEYKTIELWKIDEKGSIINKIDITKARGGNTIMPRSMAVDQEGRYYLLSGGGGIHVIDKDGNLVCNIIEDAYVIKALGRGKDGLVYATVLVNENDCAPGVVGFNIKEERIEKAYRDILPGDSGAYSVIMPGASTDFLIYGRAGVFSYNFGDKEAEMKLAPYELPYGPILFLADGTVFIMEGEYIGSENNKDTIIDYKVKKFYLLQIN